MSIKVCELCGFIPCICDQSSLQREGTVDPLIANDLETRAPRFGPDKCEDAVLPFGKHKNKALAQVLIDAPGYLEWMRRECKLYEPFASAFAEFYEKYQPDIEKGVEEQQERYYRQRHH